jgi:hypothetical protein
MTRTIRRAGCEIHIGEIINAFDKTGGKRPLERPRRRWEENIKIDLADKNMRMGPGFIWLRTDTSFGVLLKR